MFRELDRLNDTITEIPDKWTRPGTSPECIRCYAETLSLKRGWSPKPWDEEFEDQNVRLRPERFREIRKIPVNMMDGVRLAGDKPSNRTRIFMASMGDLFHRNVPDSFLHEMWETMMVAPHIYMLLTKRPERAMNWPGPWPDNIWLGTTCGHPMTKWRIECLRRSKATVRFISMEPLLDCMLPLDLTGIDQVIVGGESGNGFRPMKQEWARQVRDVCGETAFFYKQDAAYQTERRPWLVEADGRKLEYHQFPGELSVPILQGPTETPGLHIVG